MNTRQEISNSTPEEACEFAIKIAKEYKYVSKVGQKILKPAQIKKPLF